METSDAACQDNEFSFMEHPSGNDAETRPQEEIKQNISQISPVFKISRRRKNKGVKCRHPGCELTFKRPSELTKHEHYHTYEHLPRKMFHVEKVHMRPNVGL